MRGPARQLVTVVLQPGDEHLEVVDGLVEFLAVPNRRVQHDVQVLDHLADRLVTLADLRSQLRGLFEDVVNGAALTLEHGDQRRRLRSGRCGPRARPRSAGPGARELLPRRRDRARLL